MRIKSVVKVMNFHSLLRVDASRTRAERLLTITDELEKMMSIIMNNKNLRIDRLIKLPDPDLPGLRIYIGSDFGFCGNVNSSVNAVLAGDDAKRVIIGKKLTKSREYEYYTLRDAAAEDFSGVSRYLKAAVKERRWSSVELVYNHYYNSSSIRQEIRRIYPLAQMSGSESGTFTDFVMESDSETMLEDMMIEYLIYEVKIAMASSYASENIMRQNTTSESIKKIEEIEDTELRNARKEKNAAAFRKTIDTFTKQKALRRV